MQTIHCWNEKVAYSTLFRLKFKNILIFLKEYKNILKLPNQCILQSFNQSFFSTTESFYNITKKNFIVQFLNNYFLYAQNLIWIHIQTEKYVWKMQNIR